MGMEGHLDQSGNSVITLRWELGEMHDRPAYLNITGDVDNVTVRDRSGLELDFNQTKEGNNTLVSMKVPYDFVEVEIISDSLTQKIGPLWTFDVQIEGSEPTNLTGSLGLPTGAILSGATGDATDSVDSLSIILKPASFGPSHPLDLNAQYRLKAQEPSLDLPLLGAIALAIILLVTGVYIFARDKQQKKTANAQNQKQPPRAGAQMQQEDANLQQQTPLTQTPSQAKAQAKQAKTLSLEENSTFRTLDETDKEIIREMHAQGGKTTQAHIYLQTHVPKATLSRRLATLERRGIIKKSQKGNRNLISLTDIFGK